MRASLLVQSGELKMAINDYLHGIALAPEDKGWLPAGKDFAKTLLLHKATNVENPDPDEVLEAATALIEDADCELQTHLLAYWRRADAYGAQGRWKEALADYTCTIELTPEKQAALYNARAKCYGALNEIENAVADFSEAYSLDGNPEYLLLRGKGRHELGRHEEAVADFTEVLRQSPDSPEAYMWRASSHLRLENYDACLADCEKTVIRLPNIAQNWHMIGLARSGKKEFEKAVHAFDRAIEIDNNFADAYLYRSCAFAELGDEEAAEADRKKAVELNPAYREHVELLIFLKNSVLDLDAPAEKAIEFLSDYIAMNPQSVSARWYRGARYCQLKKWKEAYEDLDEYLRFHPEAFGVRQGRIRVAMALVAEDRENAEKLNARETAIADCTFILEGNAKKPTEKMEKAELLMYRTVLLRLQGDYAKALADGEAICALMDAKEAPTMRLRCAILLLKMAEQDSEKRAAYLEKALEYAETVLTAHEPSGEAFYCRGKVFETMGETEKADENFRKAKELGFENDEDSFFRFEIGEVQIRFGAEE